jgi:hypothetical protein
MTIFGYTEDRILPQWLLGLLGFAALAGFIAYALRQGTKVTPDPNNSNFGPSQASGSSDGGSSDGGGHSF